MGELDEFSVSCLMALHFADEDALRSVLVLFGHDALSALAFGVLSPNYLVRPLDCYPFLDRFHNKAKCPAKLS